MELKNMSKLLEALRKNDSKVVHMLIEKKPALLASVAPQRSRYAGMQPLQIAICIAYAKFVNSGYRDLDLAMVNFLLDIGAEVNAVPQGSQEQKKNHWGAFIDAAFIASMSCRWNSEDEWQGYKEYSSAKCAVQGRALMQRMLELGADVNQRGDYGNTALSVICYNAREFLPEWDWQAHCPRTQQTHRLTPKLREDLLELLYLLLTAGADVDYYEQDPWVSYMGKMYRSSELEKIWQGYKKCRGMSIKEEFGEAYIGELLHEAQRLCGK